MFHRLPPELCLETIAYLPIPDLSVLQLVSRSCRDLIREHEDVLYHQAAFQHRFIHSFNTTLEQAKDYLGEQSLATGWKLLCAERYALERAWLGRGPSLAVEMLWPSSGEGLPPQSVHRFKIDQEQGIAITTYTSGGLLVLDLRENALGKPLWGLPGFYVRKYAHCEYENGFLIFDCNDGSKEIWRHAIGAEGYDVTARDAQPDADMIDVDFMAKQLFGRPTRGRFLPWARLEIPEISRAYRFVYPTLLVAGLTRLFLFDVPRATLVQDIADDAFADDALGDVTYVELDARHAFVALTGELRVFNRASGKLSLSISAATFRRRVPLFKIGRERQGMVQESLAVLVGQPLLQNHNGGPLGIFASHIMAVHASPCGTHLAILFSNNRLALIENFERLVDGRVLLDDIVTDIAFGTLAYSRYLAFGDNKVAVATTSGIFVITLDTALHGHAPKDSTNRSGCSFPRLAVTCAAAFNAFAKLRALSCLQLSRTAVFFTWAPPIPNPSAFRQHGAALPNKPPAAAPVAETQIGTYAAVAAAPPPPPIAPAFFEDNDDGQPDVQDISDDEEEEWQDSKTERCLCCIDVGPRHGLDGEMAPREREAAQRLP